MDSLMHHMYHSYNSNNNLINMTSVDITYKSIEAPHSLLHDTKTLIKDQEPL